MEATEQFLHEMTVYYDLACCETLSGNTDLARGWLKELFKLEPGLPSNADMAEVQARFRSAGTEKYQLPGQRNFGAPAEPLRS